MKKPYLIFGALLVFGVIQFLMGKLSQSLELTVMGAVFLVFSSALLVFAFFMKRIQQK